MLGVEGPGVSGNDGKLGKLGNVGNVNTGQVGRGATGGLLVAMGVVGIPARSSSVAMAGLPPKGATGVVGIPEMSGQRDGEAAELPSAEEGF